MNFTDTFINKPVLAIVVSLLILVLGLRALADISVRQYPKTENAVVTVTTAYYGADAQTVAGFITQPLEQAIAQAQGIDYLSSSSATGQSTITATLRLNYDANRALTQIQTQVTSVRNQLPPQAQQPVLNIQVGETIDAMYMGFRSDVLPSNSITDYLARVVKPKLDAVQGVQTAVILGGRQFALRAWLDPARLAAHGVTAADVYRALSANNYLAAVGTTKGQAVSVDLTASTDLHSVDEFKQLSIKQSNGAIVRLEDVATVVLGAEDYNFNVSFSGKLAVFIGIKVAPDANILEVAQRVRNAMPDIQAQLPIGFQKGLTGALFTEFAFTLAGAVTVSAVIALTLSPMMCSRFFSSEQESGRFVQFIDRQFERVRHGYQRALHGVLKTWSVIVVMGALLFGATILLGMTTKSELTPEEDQGFLFYQLKASPNATAQQMLGYSQQMFAIGKTLPEYEMMFQLITPA